MKIKYFLITAVLATAILCSAGFVSAQATDNSALIAQLQAQIQSLMQQIQQLIAQQGGQSWCHTFNNYSVAGSTNGDVSYLQTALTKQGFDVSGDAQGTFSDDTAAAVVQFQGKYGIKQTGTVGPITRAKLNSLYGCGTTLPPQTCTPNWQCRNWSTCAATGPGPQPIQTRTCTDTNNCNLTKDIPQPVTVQACTPSTQPSITITSPNGGENWNVGETHNITWNSFGLTGNVSIYRGSSTGAFSMSAYQIATVPVSAGSYSWVVDKYAVGSDVIQVVGNAGITGTSNAFNIASSSTQPSITITSPLTAMPGYQVPEGWAIGTTHNITWTSTGLTSNDVLSISLIDDVNHSIYNITPASQTILSSLNSYSWTVPTSVVPSSTYFIEIDDMFRNPAGYITAKSNYFSILAGG